MSGPNTSNGQRPLDYYEALKAREQTADVKLGGQLRTVRRSRLGLQLQLQELLAQFGDDVIGLAVPYVSLASGLPEDQIFLDEVAEAFNALMSMNAPKGIAALQRYVGAAQPVPPAFNYSGRGAAAIVHDLAYSYGWTVDQVLDLAPEEAWIYLQEIHLDRHEERKWHYQLSDVGRDKKGKQKPMTDPPWFRIGYDQPGPRRRPPPGPAIRPTGDVTNLNAIAPQRSK